MDVESTLFLSSEKREKKGKETISKELLLSLYKGVMARRETAECELPPFVDWQPSSPAGKTILLSVSFLFRPCIIPFVPDRPVDRGFISTIRGISD